MIAKAVQAKVKAELSSFGKFLAVLEKNRLSTLASKL